MACIRCLCFFGSKISCLSLEISVGGCWSFWGNIPWHKPYVKIYTDYWNVKVWNRVRFFAFWNRGRIGYVTLSFHFQRQQFIPEVGEGKSHGVVWKYKNGFHWTCWTIIYCNPTISYSNYLALVHRSYHYFFSLKILVQLLGILNKYFNTPVCIHLNRKLNGIQSWLKTGNL